MEIKTVTEFSLLSESERDKCVKTAKLNKTEVYSKKILLISKVYKRVEELLIDIQNIKKDKTVKGKTQDSEEKHMFCIEAVFQKYNIPEKSIDEGKDIFYIKHPNGTQKFPDYRLYYGCKETVKFINFELKSSKTKTILWNDGFPDKEDTIYVFTDTKQNKTSLFTCKSTPPGDIETYKKQCEKISELNKEFKVESNFNFYTRKAISQKFVENKNDFIDCKNLLYKLLDEYSYSD